MNWLKRKIKEHNERLTYVDYEETWVVAEWLCSIISLTLLILIPSIIIAIQDGNPIIALIGLCFSAIIIWWHFWHIMH